VTMSSPIRRDSRNLRICHASRARRRLVSLAKDEKRRYSGSGAAMHRSLLVRPVSVANGALCPRVFCSSSQLLSTPYHKVML